LILAGEEVHELPLRPPRSYSKISPTEDDYAWLDIVVLTTDIGMDLHPFHIDCKVSKFAC